MFDLSRDPREEHNLAAEGEPLPRPVAELREAVSGAERRAFADPAVDEALADQLRALGYVD